MSTYPLTILQRPTAADPEPYVRWQEPQLRQGLLWDRVKYVRALSTVIKVGDDFKFAYTNNDDKDQVIVPYESVVSFAIATSSELYTSGDEKQATRPSRYRDPWVIYAQFDRPQGKGVMIMGLTWTSASKAEVIALHGVLTETFIVNRESVKAAVALKADRWRRQETEAFQKPQLLPGVAQGGRRFVYVHKTAYPSEDVRQKTCPHPVADVNRLTREDLLKVRSSMSSFCMINWFDVLEKDGRPHTFSKGVEIHPDGGYETGGLLQFQFRSERYMGKCCKRIASLKDVVELKGVEIQVPSDYLPFAAFSVAPDSRILCAGFSDGELLPLTLAAPRFDPDLEKLRAGILEAARAMSAAGDGPADGAQNLL